MAGALRARIRLELAENVAAEMEFDGRDGEGLVGAFATDHFAEHWTRYQDASAPKIQRLKTKV